MSDHPDVGKQTCHSKPVVVVEKRDDQDLTRVQGVGKQIPSFKEKLLGQSGTVQGSYSIAELDVEVTNRRRRNVNLHGAVGRNSGVTRNKKVMGSRFESLSSDIMDVNEEITELQPLGDVSGRRDVLRKGSLATTECEQGTQDIVGSVENSSREVAEARVEADGVNKAVASLEKVAMVTSSLNSEKHMAVLVGSTEETRIHWNTKGRVLPASIRGSTVKSGSRFQLGVKGGASTSIVNKKVVDRSASKAKVSGRLANLVSDLDKAAAEEEPRATMSRKPTGVDKIQVD
ncbi:hypothetical protein V6N11_051645 [Hibiscus sabdariffa]|uniref:Uncharacterized protein n=1 Tax=Hibiscus sabdariffa TaxID=183260 RepID=A0ABR2U7Y8_9ROSI